MSEKKGKEIEWVPYRPEQEKRDWGKILGLGAALLVVVLIAATNLWRSPPWERAPAVATAMKDTPTLEARVAKLEAVFKAAGLDLGRVVIREGKVFVVPEVEKDHKLP